MAACKTCGQPAGMLSDKCRDCKEREQAQAEAALAAETAATAAAHARAVADRRAAWVEDQVRLLDRTLQGGVAAYLQRSVYVTVPSVVNGETLDAWNPELVRTAGLQGWRIVGVVPRTVGMGLLNTQSGTSSPHWGGGMGGNVAGAYVLLELAISTEEAESRLPIARAYFDEEAVARFPD